MPQRFGPTRFGSPFAKVWQAWHFLAAASRPAELEEIDLLSGVRKVTCGVKLSRRWNQSERPMPSIHLSGSVVVGRAALEKARINGLKHILVGLESVDRGIPRDGYRVLDLGGNEIGYVTSGSYAPFLKKNIALAYVPLDFAALDTEVAVECRSLNVKCKVVPIPFYKRPKKQS